MLDVSRAHFYFKGRRQLRIRHFDEDSKSGHVEKLQRTLYGSRDKVNVWDNVWNEFFCCNVQWSENGLSSLYLHSHREEYSHGWRHEDELVFEVNTIQLTNCRSNWNMSSYDDKRVMINERLSWTDRLIFVLLTENVQWLWNQFHDVWTKWGQRVERVWYPERFWHLKFLKLTTTMKRCWVSLMQQHSDRQRWSWHSWEQTSQCSRLWRTDLRDTWSSPRLCAIHWWR